MKKEFVFDATTPRKLHEMELKCLGNREGLIEDLIIDRFENLFFGT
jgi:hypothetical protein